MRWIVALCFICFLAYAVKADDTCLNKPCHAGGFVVAPLLPPKPMPGPGITVNVPPAPKASRPHKVIKFLLHPFHRKCK